MGLIFNGNGDVIKAVDGSLTVQGLDLGGGTNVNAGLGTFSDLNVTGTLTYEDVKNVDSVGIISARQSIHVGYGVSAAGIITATSYRGDGSQLTGITQVGGATTVGFDDNKPIYFGSEDDYKIYWNNTKMYFEPTSSSTTQQLEIVSNNQMYINSKDSGLFLMSANQNVIDIYGGGGGGVYFKHNGTQKLKLEGGNWTYLNSATVTHAGDVFIPDKIVHSGDTNTAIRFPAADTITAETGGSERVRIASDGHIFVANEAGTIDTTARLGEGHRLQLSGLSSNDGISVVRYSTSYGPWGFNMGRSKSGTLGTNTIVGNHNDLGHITFWGADGSDFNQACQISGVVDGTPSDGTDMPGRLVFKTTPDGSGTPTERLRITSAGDLKFNQTQSKINLNTADGSDNKYLSINGGGDASQSRGAGISLYGNEVSSHEGRLQLLAGNSSNDNGIIQMHTGGNERLRIDRSGRVLIGVTAVSISSSQMFEVSGMSYFSNNSSSTGTIYIKNAHSNTAVAPHIVFTDGGGNRAGLSLDNAEMMVLTGQGGYKFLTGGTVGGGTEKIRITSGGQLIQYTTHTSGTAPHQLTSWYGDDASHYTIQVADFNEMYAEKTVNTNEYTSLIYKRETMTDNCDIEFTLTGQHDSSGSGYYHLGMLINSDGSDTEANFDRMVFRTNGGNSSLNSIRTDKWNGGHGFYKESSSFPMFFDGNERHILIQIRKRQVVIHVDGTVKINERVSQDWKRSHGFFGFGIYEASSVNPWIKVRNFKIKNYTPEAVTGPGWSTLLNMQSSSNSDNEFEVTNMGNPSAVEIRFWRLRHSGGHANTYLKLGHTGGYASGSIYSDIGQYQTHNSTAATMARGYLQSVGWSPMHWDFTNSTNYYSGFIRINRISNPGVNHKFTYESSITVDYDSGNTQYWIRCNGRMDMGSTNDWDRLSLYTSTGTNFVYGDVSILAQY